MGFRHGKTNSIWITRWLRRRLIPLPLPEDERLVLDLAERRWYVVDTRTGREIKR
jgi:hypothetical protein